MPRREPEAGRSAVVEHVNREAVEADDFGKALDDIGEVVERIVELVPRRHVRLTEARQVRRDDMEAIHQERDQIAKHVTGARKAMEQEQLRRIGRSSFPIEDLEAIHVGGLVLDGGHGVSPLGRE